MKNYKFLVIVLVLTILGILVTVTYIDLPVPDKLINKIIDVNDKVAR